MGLSNHFSGDISHGGGGGFNGGTKDTKDPFSVSSNVACLYRKDKFIVKGRAGGMSLALAVAAGYNNISAPPSDRHTVKDNLQGSVCAFDGKAAFHKAIVFADAVRHIDGALP